MKRSEIYEKTADTIETYGHNRGDYGSLENGVCVLGALHFVTRGSIPTSEFSLDLTDGNIALTLAIKQLEQTVGVRPIYEWSDDIDTQELLDTLRSAAKDARLEEEGLTS